MINESGLYSLIFNSKLDSAKKFKHWITSEVLPTLRTHGIYAVDKEVEKSMILKAEYFDNSIDTAPLTSIDETAKILNIKPHMLKLFLLESRMVYRINNVLVPKAYTQNNGYIVHKEYSERSVAVYPHFTLKGRMHVYKEIKEKFESPSRI